MGPRAAVKRSAANPGHNLAYADGQVENAPLRVTLSDLDTGPVRLPAAEIALVWQAHDGHRITWEPITTIPLSTALRPAP